MPSILVIDDKESMRTMLSDVLTDEGYQVDAASGGKEGLDLARVKGYDLAITDMKMPDVDGLEVLSGLKNLDNDMSVIIMTAYGTVETAVAAMKSGAYDFVFDPDHLTVIVERALENRRLLAENSLLREELAQSLGFSEIIGQNEKMKDVSRLIQKVAGSDTSVLLQGESGPGKELFARAIHNLSPRRDKPYVAINCAAIPRELLENELSAEMLRASRRKQVGKCRCPCYCRHQYGSGRDDQEKTVPRRPLLSPLGFPGHHPAASRTLRRYQAAGRLFYQ